MTKMIWRVFVYMLAWWGLFNIMAFAWMLMQYHEMSRPINCIRIHREEPPPVPVEDELAPWLDLSKQFEV